MAPSRRATSSWQVGGMALGELTPVTRLGECMLHKGKSNSNGTFSRGKTWRLSDMRALEQIGVSRPLELTYPSRATLPSQ